MGTFHENLLQSFQNFKNKFLKASDGLVFQFTKDTTTGKYGYKDSNGNFVPFKTSHTLTRTVSSGTSAQTVDMGEDHEYRYISVSAISPQRSNGTAANTSGTDTSGPYVYFPYGWYPQANSNGSFIRMTQAQAQAAHSHTATTATRTTNGTWDIGEKHNYRYIKISVPSSYTTGSFSHPESKGYNNETIKLGWQPTYVAVWTGGGGADSLNRVKGYNHWFTDYLRVVITSTGFQVNGFSATYEIWGDYYYVAIR